MSFSFGDTLRVTLFGQSHAEAIGAVIEGLPPGETIDLDEVNRFMARRAPGKSPLSTPRKETDIPRVLSGLVGGKTCGSPVSAIIENRDARSSDYRQTLTIPRPAHADFSAGLKYGEWYDHRGGGHFSGRMTAPLCFAGAVALQILRRRGVEIGAHIASIGGIQDKRFDPVRVDAQQLSSLRDSAFPVLDLRAGESMKNEIARAADRNDSVGGTIECAALDIPGGLGGPLFGGIESKMAVVLFGIPAVKAVEFGAGFQVAAMWGSEHNDAFYYDGETVKTKTNRHGGILGGISTGMPIILRTAFKPTPSIGISQQTVDLHKRCDTTLSIQGRHDPCIVPRAVPCVEAAVAAVLLDLML